ncbi:MAG: helix-turn-helix transcriptional regulator [Massilia sp.]
MAPVNASSIPVDSIAITISFRICQQETKVESLKPVVDRLIRIHEVVHICGLSRSSIYASIQKGEFPCQVKLSRKASAWVYSEVMAWAAARAASRSVEWLGDK